MTMNLITLGKYLIPAAAVSMSIFGTAHSIQAHNANENLPLTCEIAVSKGSFGPTYVGRVHATETVSGHYNMKFAKTGSNSASIKQSGNFTVRAGETATLGQAGFGGSAPVEAKLVVEFDGHKMTCATDAAIDL